MAVAYRCISGKKKDITHINNANSPREKPAFAHLDSQCIWL